MYIQYSSTGGTVMYKLKGGKEANGTINGLDHLLKHLVIRYHTRYCIYLEVYIALLEKDELTMLIHYYLTVK